MWSTVVSQPSSAGRARPRSARGARRAASAAGVDDASSPQALQVGDERVEVGAARAASVRHPVARLDVLRVGDPARERAGVVRDRQPRRASCALATCVRSGPTSPVAPACRGSRGSSAQPSSRKTVAAARCSARRRRARRPRLFAQPARGTRAGGSATTYERHVRVLEAAELGALAAVDARARRPRAAIAVRPARDQVDLPVQLRDPEAVDHVVGRRRRRRTGASAPGCGSRSR